MNRYKLISYLFVLLGALVIVGSLYVIITYASDLINAIVDFVTTNDYSKLQQCGVSSPPQFNKLKGEFATVILPSLFIGLPLLLIVLSALMFLAGSHYRMGKLQEDAGKHEEMKREMIHKIRKKMGIGAPQDSRSVTGPKAAGTKMVEASDKGGPEDEPDEDGPEEDEPDEGPEEPAPSKVPARKK